MVDDLAIQLSTILLIVILGAYTIFSALISGKKSYLHESSLAIIIGLVIGSSIKYAGYDEFNKSSRFNGKFFFFVLIPPIVFSAGYNFKRKRFFKNF